MKDLNLIVPLHTTVAFTQEEWEDLWVSIPEEAFKFHLQSDQGDEGHVIQNAPDDYLVWFVGATYKNVGEDRVIDQLYVSSIDDYYTAHAALDGMCLQMKVDATESMDADGIPL